MPMNQTKLLWLDDARFAPTNEWYWAETAAEAIELLKKGVVKFASLDQDLAPEHYPWSGVYDKESLRLTSGEAVVLFLEEEAFNGRFDFIPTFGMRVHSMNYHSAEKMIQGVQNIYGRDFQCDRNYGVLPWDLSGQPSGWMQHYVTMKEVLQFRGVKHSK